MKNINKKPENLSELVAAYEAILAHEGLAPIDGETFDVKFYEKKETIQERILEAQRKADADLDRLLFELGAFSSEIKEKWAMGELTDGQIHELYRDYEGNPNEFPKDKLSKEVKDF